MYRRRLTSPFDLILQKIKVKKLEEKNKSPFVIDAEKAYDKGNYFEAALLYSLALERQPGSEEIREALARSYGHAEEFNKSISVYKDLANSFPNNIMYLSNTGTLYLIIGKYREAEEYIVRALEKDPESQHLIKSLGKCKFAEGEFIEALSLLKKIAEKDPTKLEYLRLLARTYLRLENEEKALYYALKCFEADPNYPMDEELKRLVNDSRRKTHKLKKPPVDITLYEEFGPERQKIAKHNFFPIDDVIKIITNKINSLNSNEKILGFLYYLLTEEPSPFLRVGAAVILIDKFAPDGISYVEDSLPQQNSLSFYGNLTLYLEKLPSISEEFKFKLLEAHTQFIRSTFEGMYGDAFKKYKTD